MSLQEELDLIKKAKVSVAEIDLKKRKVFDDLIKKIEPSGRLESTMWDYVMAGINCYEYDLETLLKNRRKNLDPE
tara:strand:- start:15780 stop:16004 length:225 start_codon:yes stop_codon:yes gene_type:complete